MHAIIYMTWTEGSPSIGWCEQQYQLYAVAHREEDGVKVNMAGGYDQVTTKTLAQMKECLNRRYTEKEDRFIVIIAEGDAPDLQTADTTPQHAEGEDVTKLKAAQRVWSALK
jgi:hypothetical protein